MLRCAIVTVARFTSTVYFASFLQGIVYVVDANDKDRLEKERDYLHQTIQQEGNSKKYLLVFANKQDLPSAAGPDELVEALELSKLEMVWKIQGCCAISGEGVADGFEWLIDHMSKR
eukprot:c18008_g1_i2.p2 GENE.c18008_g1_i2~~c18008_g1_i2.p2  ORF type:complete len:117 (+),score=30.25 c18008_g1_i2:291-641(+)